MRVLAFATAMSYSVSYSVSPSPIGKEPFYGYRSASYAAYDDWVARGRPTGAIFTHLRRNVYEDTLRYYFMPSERIAYVRYYNDRGYVKKEKKTFHWRRVPLTATRVRYESAYKP